MPSRRKFLTHLATGAVAMAFHPMRGNAAAGPGSIRVAAKAAPNFLVILLDDVGRDCLAYAGGKSFATPRIDALAASGLRFETCYGTPMCCPSRVQILTGQYSFRNYVGWNFLDPRDPTFATLLRDAGYATALAGKWHFDGWQLREPAIVTAGFERYVSYDYEGVRTGPAARQQGNYYWNTPLHEDGIEKLLPDTYVQDYYVDYLCRFINQNRHRPFLAHCCLDLLHRPFSRAPTGKSSTWPDGPVSSSELGMRGNLDNFPGMVARTDLLVGRLIDALSDAGVLENTVVVFTSDNGTDNVNEALNLRVNYRGRSVMGGKYLVNELGVNVPLVISWPGHITPGATEELADLSDILPTLADYAGVNERLPSDLDGRSLRPVLEGGHGTKSDLYSWGILSENRTSLTYQLPMTHKDRHLHALRDRRWKYLSNDTVYDLAADPFEERPFAPGDAAEADAVRERLAARLRVLRSSPPIRW